MSRTPMRWKSARAMHPI